MAMAGDPHRQAACLAWQERLCCTCAHECEERKCGYIACNPDTVCERLCQEHDWVQPTQVQGASVIKHRVMTCNNNKQHGLTVGHELLAALTLFAIVYTPM